MDKTLQFLLKTNDLQKTKRYGNYPDFSESTSDHTFKVLLMIDYFYKEFELNLDYKKCIQLAIYHDFGEMDLTQDVDIKENKDKILNKNKEIYENDKIKELSETYYSKISDYYFEYKEKNTLEARFVNACDKIEGMIHPMTVGRPIMNHEIFANYADKAVQNFPQFMSFYKLIKSQLKDLYIKWDFVWKEEYEMVFKDKQEV